MRDVMLIVHFIGLAMGLGTGFAHAFLGAAASKMSPADATKFKMNSLVISYMGHVGIALLLVSGFYMITPYWRVLSSYPWLIVKLSLVAILTVLIVLISIAARKAKNGDEERQLAIMKKLGQMTLPIGIAIVIIAVKVFH